MIRRIRHHVVTCAHCLHSGGRSVLVHCSDGWDRTAQVCVLTQLLLDPYYRTLRGLATLLDKDMVAFGHKAAERLGFRPPGIASAEWSPIWLQLLDCIQQLVQQFPSAFEYTPAALALIATHCYAGFVTTFRHNTQAELTADPAASRTTSVWHQLLVRHRHLTNPRYKPWPLTRGPLRPACTLQRLHVWSLHLPPARDLAAQQIAEASWCDAAAADAAVASALDPAAGGGGRSGRELSAHGQGHGGSGVGGSVGASETLIVDTNDLAPGGTARATAGKGSHGQNSNGAVCWQPISGRVTHATRVADASRGDFTLYHIEVTVVRLPGDADKAKGSASRGQGEAANGSAETDHGSTQGRGHRAPQAGNDERIRQLGRRYSDFSHLDTCIRAAGLPNNVVAHLPTLPTTFTFNKFSDSVVDARRTALDRYVRALLTAPSSNVLASMPEVQDFFEEGDAPGDAVEAH